MSQCYRVQLKESVSRVVKGEDSISYPIELTQILPADEMFELLKQELKEKGWQAEDDSETIFVTEGSGGEKLSIDLETMELTASIVTEREVKTVAEVESASEHSDAHAQQQAKQALAQEVSMRGDQIEDAGNKELQDEVTEQLAESESDRQRQINEILQKVYSESLKKKAHELGDVMEVAESTSDDGEYELTIRIQQ